MDPDRRERIRRAFEMGTFRKIVATDVWTTDVSFDALTVLFKADARSSAILDEQIPGRVSRFQVPSGKAVVDLHDCAP